MLTMPVEIRQHLNVKRGEYVVWSVDKKNRVIVEKLSPKKHPGFFMPGTGWLKHAK